MGQDAFDKDKFPRSSRFCPLQDFLNIFSVRDRVGPGPGPFIHPILIHSSNSRRHLFCFI